MQNGLWRICVVDLQMTTKTICINRLILEKKDSNILNLTKLTPGNSKGTLDWARDFWNQQGRLGQLEKYFPAEGTMFVYDRWRLFRRRADNTFGVLLTPVMMVPIVAEAWNNWRSICICYGFAEFCRRAHWFLMNRAQVAQTRLPQRKPWTKNIISYWRTDKWKLAIGWDGSHLMWML